MVTDDLHTDDMQCAVRPQMTRNLCQVKRECLKKRLNVKLTCKGQAFAKCPSGGRLSPGKQRKHMQRHCGGKEHGPIREFFILIHSYNLSGCPRLAGGRLRLGRYAGGT